MNVVAFVLFTLAQSPTVPTQPAAGEKLVESRAVRFVIDADRRVYDIRVNFQFATTVWFPQNVRCVSATVGDREKFATVLVDPVPNRIIITPLVEEIGATTNVTIDCDQGIRAVLALTHTKPEDALQAVEFVFSPEESERITAAVAKERLRGEGDCAQRIDGMKEQLDTAANDRLLRGMLRRFATNDDVELARENFFVAKVFQQVLFGDRAMLLFHVQNKTSKEVVVKDVEVLLQANRQPMDGVTLVLPERRVAPDAIVVGVVAFDAPEAVDTLVLVIREDGPRILEVDDIDF